MCSDSLVKIDVSKWVERAKTDPTSHLQRKETEWHCNHQHDDRYQILLRYLRHLLI